MKSFKIISEIAGAQHGLISTRQFKQNGFSSNQISRFRDCGYITQVCRGVFSLAGSSPTWEYRACLATLANGPKAYLSHESALQLFNLFEKQNSDTYRKRRPRHKRNLIHITIPRTSYRTSEIFFHRSKILDSKDTQNVTAGIPHVSVERALIESAQQLKPFELDFAIEKALSLNLVSPPRLISLLQKLPSGPGREKNKLKSAFEPYIVGSRKAKSESRLESRVYRIVTQIDSGAIAQYELSVGHKNYRLDIAIPKKRIAIEVDGFEFHRDRSTFDNDRRRQNDLVGSGWTIVRITAKFTDIEIFDAVSSVLAQN